MVLSVSTLGELWLQRQRKEFDDPFAIDDHGGQQILNLHAQASPIAHAPPVMPADQVGQFPFDAGMLPPHGLILSGLRPVLRRVVLRGIITLGD